VKARLNLRNVLSFSDSLSLEAIRTLDLDGVTTTKARSRDIGGSFGFANAENCAALRSFRMTRLLLSSAIRGGRKRDSPPSSQSRVCELRQRR
jgi:hypothetical protein